MNQKKVEYLVVDTSAFIQNASLHEIAENIITCRDVVNEITNKRQLKRLVVLPYDLIIKDVFPENIKIVTDFSKKTGDYVSLSATDIKVMALTYQLEKEKVGIDHIRTEPVVQKSVNYCSKPEVNANLPGFYNPNKRGNKMNEENSEAFFDTVEDPSKNDSDNESNSSYESCFDEEHIECNFYNNEEGDDENEPNDLSDEPDEEEDANSREEYDGLEDVDGGKIGDGSGEEDDDDDEGWITPSNIKKLKQRHGMSELAEENSVTVGCMTTDFAMQNVLKQMNLNVCALDGRVIKHLRTFILRCYACFKTTSIMTKRFCPKCGNDTLKKVAVSLDENGKLQIYINMRRPLTGRGKKFSLPTFKGGKHPNNPIIVEDQPIPQNRPSKLARTKIDPLEHDYIPGYSPFATRDVNSRSALLGIKPKEYKHWMKKNPNEARRRRK